MGSDEEEEDEEDEEDEAAPFLACTARPGLPAAKTRTVRRSGQTVQPRGRRTQAIDAERARGRARTSWASGGRACGLAPGGRRDCGREQGSRGAEVQEMAKGEGRAPREGVRRRGARRRQADPASRWPQAREVHRKGGAAPPGGLARRWPPHGAPRRAGAARRAIAELRAAPLQKPSWHRGGELGAAGSPFVAVHGTRRGGGGREEPRARGGRLPRPLGGAGRAPCSGRERARQALGVRNASGLAGGGRPMPL
ncbi:unnamed protein product [Prorocentrum cordatum]|uniref:Uncharacterized protein n=1 Tax=Prorocentrum cordatum TaxID=2364126 RepID=A0ABN9UNC5_9DINO|nr:unnamed protein product [Polarella glacialis]